MSLAAQAQKVRAAKAAAPGVQRVVIDFGDACPAGADGDLARFLETAVQHFGVAVWWCGSPHQEGRARLRGWLGQQLLSTCRDERVQGAERRASDILRRIGFPTERPAGLVLRVSFAASG